MSEANFIINLLKGKNFFELLSTLEQSSTIENFDVQFLQEAINKNGWKVSQDKTTENKIRREISDLLELFEMTDFNILLIDSDEIQAFNLMGGKTIAFTFGLLNSLENYDELRGIAAHELSHNLFAKLSYMATEKNDLASFKQIELLCDGLGAMALRHLGKSVDGLKNFISKLPASSPFSTHPNLTERLEVITAVT